MKEMEQFGKIRLYNAECMEVLSLYPDNFFDLAIVDPPYGIGQNWAKDKQAKFYKHRNKFNDKIPDQAYFNELFRVSKHQIIWGCNYYWNFLEPSNHIIIWNKGKDAVTQHGSSAELAWTSITKYPMITVDMSWNGCITCEKTIKIHPHQKPVKLYAWTLKHFAERYDKILDTGFGSLSLGIACHDLDFDLWAIEKDPQYYEDGKRRLIQHQQQQKIGFLHQDMYHTNTI